MAVLGSIQLDVDTSAFDQLEAAFEEALEEGMDQLMEEVEWAWRAEASKSLNESRQAYLDGLSFHRIGRDFEVSLKGWVPVALETGSPPFDLKPGFLKAGKGGGLYRDIPMGYPTWDRIRRVTPFSPGWQHPGMEQRGIGDRIQNQVENEIVPAVFNRVFAKISL